MKYLNMSERGRDCQIGTDSEEKPDGVDGAEDATEGRRPSHRY